MKRWMMWTLFVLGLLGASPALAQETYATVSEAQRQLNEEGIRMASAGNHEQAVQLFRSSLALDELNVTYLNLGRSLAVLGRCDEAMQAYEKVPRTPQVKSPSPAQVLTILDNFVVELRRDCQVPLTLICEDGVMVTVNGAAAQPCTAAPILLKLGSHWLEATNAEGSAARIDFELVSFERRQITVSLPSAPRAPVQPPAASSDTSLGAATLWGGVASGVGVALLVSAILVDQLVLAPVGDAFDQAATDGNATAHAALRKPLDAIQPMNQALVIGGGVLLAGGLTLILLDLFGVFADDSPAEHAQVWTSSDGAGLMWQWRW